MRYYHVNRMILRRETKRVKTRYGEITLKVVEQPDGTKRSMPEYDDLKRIATTKKIPLKQLHDEIMRIVGK